MCELRPSQELRQLYAGAAPHALPSLACSCGQPCHAIVLLPAQRRPDGLWVAPRWVGLHGARAGSEVGSWGEELQQQQQ